jgi:hypothetical protein
VISRARKCRSVNALALVLVITLCVQSGTGAIRGYACVPVHARVCLNLNWLHMGNTHTHAGVYHFVLQCTADISTHETFQCAADGERASGFLCRPEIKAKHTHHTYFLTTHTAAHYSPCYDLRLDLAAGADIHSLQAPTGFS